MKKFFTKLLTIIASFACVLPLAACGGNDGKTVRVYMPDGAPAVALAAFMDGGYNNTEFTVVQAETIVGRLTSGAADLAVMPVNAAAQAYVNGKADIKMLTVNTHGNLFIVGDGDEITLNDLVGKRLAVINWANVPGQVFKMLVQKAGIEYELADTAKVGKITVQAASDGAAAIALMQQGKADYALLGEPAATTLSNKLSKSVVADVQKLWNAEFDFAYPQACLVARSSFIDGNKAYVDKFIADLAASDGWAEENPDRALAAVKAHAEGESTLTVLNATIVKNCNIATKPAAQMRGACDAYFTLLTNLDAGNGTKVLSSVPDDRFYYAE